MHSVILVVWALFGWCGVVGVCEAVVLVGGGARDERDGAFTAISA